MARITPVRPIAALPTEWRAKADELEPFAAAAATAFRDAAQQLDAALRDRSQETLSLKQAALESGFSADHLRHQVSAGTIPNAGTKGKPRIHREHLPRKVGRAPSGYDAAADAMRLVRSAGAR